MNRRVVVTGLGAVTSLSHEVDDLWQRILRGESGIRRLRLFDTERFKVKFGGEVADWAPTEEYASAKEVRRIPGRRHRRGAPKRARFRQRRSLSLRCHLGFRHRRIARDRRSVAPAHRKRPGPRFGVSCTENDGQRRQRSLVDCLRTARPEHRGRHRLRQCRERDGRRLSHYSTWRDRRHDHRRRRSGHHADEHRRLLEHESAFGAQ